MVDEFQLYAHHPPSGYSQYLLSKTEQQKKLAYAADDIEAQFERLKYTPQPPRTLSIRCRYCGLKAEQTTGHCVGCGAPV